MILHNGESLAYLGDALFELHIRLHLINQGINNVDILHKLAISYTSGIAQAKIMKHLLEVNFLSEDELVKYKHGRNANHSKNRRNIDMTSYKMATGFEALLGHLYLENMTDRITEIIDYAINYLKEVS